jgi:hypothetical protein
MRLDTIVQERSPQSQLVVGQTRIRRFHAWVAFDLQTADHIDNADQTDLTHPFNSHDALRIHLPFLMRVDKWHSRRLDQIMMGLIGARQATVFEQRCYACSARKWQILSAFISLQRYPKRSRSPTRM